MHWLKDWKKIERGHRWTWDFNQIGDVGADELAKGLKENSTLKSLYLAHNQIGDVGADALAKGLKENSSLTSLDLSL